MGRGSVIIVGVMVCGLLAAGCGSGSPAPAPAKVATVTTETVQVGRFTEIFATPLPAGPAQASVIEGFRAGLILWDKTQEDEKLVPPVTSDVIGAALTNLKETLTRDSTPAQAVIPAGTDRIFETRVTVLTGASATVSTCDDGSKFEQVFATTGVPDPAYSAAADQDYIFITWQMTRLNGRWAISRVTPVSLPNALAKPCQPLKD